MLEQLGMLASGALGRIGDVLDTPRRLAWSGVNTLLGNGDDGPENGADLLSRAGMDPESVWTKALGMGVDAVTDPLTYLGGFIGRGVGAVAKKAVSPGVKNLLNARREFGAVKDVTFPRFGEDFADAASRIAKGSETAKIVPGKLALGRLVGPMDEAGLQDLAKGGLDAIAADIVPTRFRPGADNGWYKGSMRAAFTPAGASDSVVRHELMHGLTQNSESLGLPQRLVNRMFESSNPFVSNLGFIGDEALARAAESRGLGKQMSGAWDFLMHPGSYYTGSVAKHSPAAAALWSAGRTAGKAVPKVAPWAAAAGAGAGVGIPAYYALSQGE